MSMNANEGKKWIKRNFPGYETGDIITGSYKTRDGISVYGLTDGDEGPVIVDLGDGKVRKLWPGE